MKRFKQVVCVTVLLMSQGALSSEVEEVTRRIRKAGYPIPLSTIQEMHQIESELTPLRVHEASQELETLEGWFCDADIVRIPYRLNPSDPIEYFEATVIRPNEYLMRRRFPEITRFPALVVQPTILGPSRLEAQISFEACLRGVMSIVPNQVLVQRPEYLSDFGVYDRTIRIDIIRARRMIDYIEQREDVESGKTGLIGFSRGAINGSLLAGIEPRIRFAFLGAGGVGVAQVIVGSMNGIVRNEADRHREDLGISEEEFKERLMKELRYDGILFSHRVKPENLKLMVVLNDEHVPTANQELLRSSFGNPETIYRNSGHAGSIVRQVFANARAFHRFFRERIGQLSNELHLQEQGQARIYTSIEENP